MLEDAVVPMCQSPKFANVLVHAKGPLTNDNCPRAETGVKSFQSAGPFAAVWQAFLGVLRQSGAANLDDRLLPTSRQYRLK
jgi:hypothetical protein